MIRELLSNYSVSRDVKPRTIEHYELCLHGFAVWLGRAIEPEDWTEETLNAYLASIRHTYSPWTCKQRRNSLSTIWRAGHKMGLIPAPHVRLCRIKTPDLVISTWSPNEIQRIFQHAEELRGCFKKLPSLPRSVFWSSWWRFGYDAALRPSDQFRIRRDQVTDRMTIVQQKTQYAVTVRLRPETLAICRRLQLCHDEPTLFPRVWGRSFSHAARRFLAACGVWGSAITIRKTSATEVERIKAGMAWIHLGHRSPETTRRWYMNALRAYDDRPLPPLPQGQTR